jgi:hypothetical protein
LHGRCSSCIAIGLSLQRSPLVGRQRQRSVVSKDERDGSRSRAAARGVRATVRTAVVAGHPQAWTSAESITTDQRNNIERPRPSDIDTAQASLAAQEGVSATPADVDAKLQVEATTLETRYVWMIEVAPVDAGAVEPTVAQKADAKAKAGGAQGHPGAPGRTCQDGVDRAATAPQVAISAGWPPTTARPMSPSCGRVQGACRYADRGGQGTDGIYRIGRASEIVPTAVDGTYQAKIQNDKIDLNQYRAVLAGDVIHDKLSAKIVADVTGPGPQRQVSEILFKAPQTPPPADAIKVRHILYSPKGDPSGAANVPATDPSWETAHQKALATYVRLQADPKLFDSIARAESDEAVAKGPAGTGGKLPYFDSTMSVDPQFLQAILAQGLKPGDLLPPVKSAFGWHVIQVMNKPPDTDAMAALKTKADGGDDFALRARDNSDGTTSGTGGDIGWIAKGQLDDKLTTAIFAAPIGKTSDVVSVDGDGVYLFKVAAEETRTPEGRQLEALKSTAFSKWYDAKKSAATITREPGIIQPNQ